MSDAPRLFSAHRKIAFSVAREFYLPGADREDVQQEALIGLWDAARSFRADGGSSFRNFAFIVIRRHLADCVTRANRLKQLVLTDAARVFGEDEDDDFELRVEDVLVEPHDLVDLIVTAEELRGLVGKLSGLTELERAAIARVVNGLGCAEDRMDNALQRAKRKLREAA